MISAHKTIEAYYLDFVNNYLTIEKFAEHHGLYVNEAQTLINLGKQINNRPHPEA